MTDVWFEGFGFGDAEVYVDGLMAYRLVDVDRSFDSTGETFDLIPERGGRSLGRVSRETAETDVRALLGLDV